MYTSLHKHLLKNIIITKKRLYHRYMYYVGTNFGLGTLSVQNNLYQNQGHMSPKLRGEMAIVKPSQWQKYRFPGK